MRIPVRETAAQLATASTTEQKIHRRWPVAPGQVERERDEHDHGGTQRDGMFRGAEDPQLGGSDANEPSRDAELRRLECGEDAAEVIEDVEPRARLDDREHCHRAAAPHECLHEGVGTPGGSG